ncbi:MAG: hypothetical protein ABIJ24_00645 [Nitrospinota bacterium]|nr:hypothetical protein [Nitrospinota bacterium]
MDKRPIFDWFYEQGDLYVTIMTTNSPLIKVPPDIMKKKFEKLVIGESSTPRLTYNEEGISVSMRFGRKFEDCFLPWDSIVVMEGEEAVIQFAVSDIEDDQVEEEGEDSNDKEKTGEKGEKKGGHLKLVK